MPDMDGQQYIDATNSRDRIHMAYRGTTIWNRLPPALYGAKTVSEFKKIVLHFVTSFFVCMYVCTVSYSYCICVLRA